MAVSFADVVEYNAATSSSHSITGNDGSEESLYILSFICLSSVTISSVTGGGLTWNQRGDTSQNVIRGITYWAFGTPTGDPFTVIVTLSATSIAAGRVVRYAGSTSTSPIVNDADASAESTAPSVNISTTGFVSNADLYYNSISHQSSAITLDGDYTGRTNEAVQSGARNHFAESADDNNPTHSKSPGNNWIIHGGIIKSAVSLIYADKLKSGRLPHLRM